MTSKRVPQESDELSLDERKRLEKALQASEERFRTLVQLSFDVYWETDAEHRFTRQDFAPTLTNTPPPGSEIGKTRWEVAYLDDEQRLFREIGGRLADALSSLVAIRNLRESERRLEAAQRVAHVGWWERDFRSGQVFPSDEATRIFGVEPVDLPQWHGRWLSLIHPDDRAKAAAASEAALQRGPRYDVSTGWCAPTARCAWSTARVT